MSKREEAYQKVIEYIKQNAEEGESELLAAQIKQQPDIVQRLPGNQVRVTYGYKAAFHTTTGKKVFVGEATETI